MNKLVGQGSFEVRGQESGCETASDGYTIPSHSAMRRNN